MRRRSLASNVSSTEHNGDDDVDDARAIIMCFLSCPLPPPHPPASLGIFVEVQRNVSVRYKLQMNFLLPNTAGTDRAASVNCRVPTEASVNIFLHAGQR